MKPIVDGLEQELGSQAKFIRVDIHDSIGNDLIPVFQVQFAPTFIFFDAQGNELWRSVGGLDVQKRLSEHCFACPAVRDQRDIP